MILVLPRQRNSERSRKGSLAFVSADRRVAPSPFLLPVGPDHHHGLRIDQLSERLLRSVPSLAVQPNPDPIEEREAQSPPSCVACISECLTASTQERERCVEALPGGIEFDRELVDLLLCHRSDLPEAILFVLQQRHRDGIGVVRLQQLPLLGFGLLEPELLLGDHVLLPSPDQLDQIHNLMLDGVQVRCLRFERFHQLNDLGLHLLHRQVGQGTAVLPMPVTTQAEEVGVVTTLALGHQQTEP